MTRRKKYRICLVGECLSTGGAEKAMALLSRFYERNGIEVHTAIVIDDVSYQFGGKLLNLGRLKKPGIFNKMKRFAVLRNYLRSHHFDFIIDFRVRPDFLQEWLISRLLYNAPAVYTVHSTLPGWYFPAEKRKARALYKNAFGLAAVSRSIAENLTRNYGFGNVAALHNPLDMESIGKMSQAEIPIDGRFILAAGRMDGEVKQFGRLIETYAKTGLPGKGVRLIILGDGKFRRAYEEKCKKLGIGQNVIFAGSVQNPYAFMSGSMFFVLSSLREGFPTVVAESLACGVPVVAFDCDSGPAELINDGNGILVKDQDFAALGSAMEKMAFDEAFRLRCVSAAKASVAHLALENVGRQWLEFLKIPVS